MRRFLVTLLVIVMMAPTMALAAAWYRCGIDGKVRAACCCPPERQDGEAPVERSPVARAECCSIEQADAAAADTRMAVDGVAALAALPVPRQVVDVGTPPLVERVRSTPGFARASSRAPPIFLSHCSLLL